VRGPQPAKDPRVDFNAYKDSYEEAVQESLPLATDAAFFSRLKADHLVELARKELGEPGRLSVLDVGCGVGATDRFLRGRFGDLAGVDVAADLVSAAAASNPWASYRSYDEGEAVPHADGSFDLTFAICVMHHVPPQQWPSFVAELSRVTRSGGLVCVMEHNPLNPLTRRAVSNCEFDDDAVLLSRRRAIRLLEDQGLAPESAPYIAFFPREGRSLRRAERLLTRVPFGAQYYVAARRP
jgi:SAM-dependent methyltransferase